MALDTIVKLTNAVIAQGDNIILSGVDLKIEKGEFVYLIGKTGSGKSSLLKTLYAAVPLKSGEGIVCDNEIHSLKNSKVPYLRRRLGIVFQDFELLTDRTVNENLLFVLKATGWKDKKKMTERMTEVLTKVGLETKGYKMPHELSGGEQQRIAIARALLNDPDLILADEPTGNLDPKTSEGIMDLLFDISKNGRAVLMATHDYILLEKFKSRIIQCEDSKVMDVALVKPSAV